MLLDASLWIVGIVLSVALSILLHDKVHWLLVRVLGHRVPRRQRSLAGLWRSRYCYPNRDGELVYQQHLIELRQVGRYITGRTIVGDKHRYLVKGRFSQEKYFTGTWDNILDNDIYHGAFQCVLEPEGKRMVGRWVGFNGDDDVMGGPWEWKLVFHKISKKLRSDLERKDPSIDVEIYLEDRSPLEKTE